MMTTANGMCLVTVMAMTVAVLLGIGVEAQSMAMAPAPAPANDGITIDQGVAYGLMIAALVVTYLVHPLDAFPYGLF